MRMRFLFSGLLSLALAACGGGAAPDEPTASPARVEILDGAALLTETGQTRALTARVLDSQGREITATVAWESSRPDNVGVSVNGELIAQGTGGVSQITARVGNLRSAPMLAVHTSVAAGALLLTDEQIVGDPEETTPGAEPSASNTYRVRLSGMAVPAVGDLLVNTGGKIVVGRVLAVQSADGVHAVTLGLLPLREVFPQLRIDEVIDLAPAEATVPADVLQNYDVQREGSTYRFTPKSGVTASAAVMRPSSQRATSAAAGPVSGTVALPPFKKCEATLEGAGGAGSLPVKLSKLPSFSLDFNPKLHTRYTPETGLERMVVSTDATFTADTSLEFSAGFDGKLTCTIELLVVRIPVGGPVAAFLSGLVTLGAGIELSGKVTLPGAKISNTYERKNTLELGVACAPDCSLVNTLSDAQVKHTADIQGPDLNDLRVEPSVFGYGLAQLAVGNPFLTSLRFNAFFGKLGVAYQTSLASREAQIASAGYQSNYQLAALLKAGLETDFGQLAAWLGFNGIAENLIELSAPLATSPSGTVTFDRASFAAGDPVTATVDFDAGSSRFLTLYNIDAVVLMRKTGNDPAREIARVRPTADGQTRLSIPFTADSAGAESELHAFVLTRALPLELAALELGQAGAPKAIESPVSAGVHHTCALTGGGAVKCWGNNMFGQLGTSTNMGSAVGSYLPTEVTGLASGVTSVGVGDLFSCALTGSGAVMCWGYGYEGRLGDGGRADSAVPVEVSGLSGGAIAVSAERGRACAITQTGGVKCWGDVYIGLGNGFLYPGPGNATDNGEDYYAATPVDIPGLSSGVVAIDVGFLHSCALTSSGGVKCWGSNANGELGDGTTTDSPLPRDVSGLSSGVIAISAGAGKTCALTRNGGVKCWGAGLAIGTTDQSLVPVDVAGLDGGVLSVSTGRYAVCGLTQVGGVRCWGYNNFGQLGNGTTTFLSTAPVGVSGLDSGGVAISVGEYHVCVLSTGGAYQCWGGNMEGQLGNGTSIDSSVPVNVLGFP